MASLICRLKNKAKSWFRRRAPSEAALWSRLPETHGCQEPNRADIAAQLVEAAQREADRTDWFPEFRAGIDWDDMEDLFDHGLSSFWTGDHPQVRREIDLT
ncbi:hypothetical protein, partial [Erythrobacter sp. YJ-T3-07]|uniref:hypothetical protein n=1 Tax=Erythrobacter sp. YJ-T3-07 TaxID=2793063 RepID=UPI001F44BABC